MIDSGSAAVTVASFRSPSEAQIARRALMSAGIDADLVTDDAVVSLTVPRADAEEAVAIVQRLWPEPVDPPVHDEPERCPDCGSPDLMRVRRLPFFLTFTAAMLVVGYLAGQKELFALLLAIVAVLLFLAPNRRCTNCGELWRSWRMDRSGPDHGPAVEPPDVACPRCGSVDTSPIYRRREKAMTLLVNFTLPPLVLLWPFLPKRRCDNCGNEWR